MNHRHSTADCHRPGRAGADRRSTEGALEPTGASVEAWDFVYYRFDDGKVVEVISFPDLYGLFLQVGLVEPPGE